MVTEQEHLEAMFRYAVTLGPYKAKVREHLQSFITQAENGEEINLLDLAKECESVLQSLLEEDDLVIYPSREQTDHRVVSVSFTKDDNNSVHTNLHTVQL